MIILATLVALSISAVLLFAALEKARAPAPTATTLRQLGLPGALGLPVTYLLSVTEFGLGVAILFTPGSTVIHIAVAALAAAFAVAGLVAVRSEEPLRCSCFGNGGGYLGWRQVLALFPWLTGLALVRVAPPTAPGALLFALTALVVVVARSTTLVIALGEARADRESAQEMLPWLPSH